MSRQAGRATSRGLALQALIAIDAGARANVILPELLGASALDERDRRLATELVYGTCRMRRACAWLVDRHVKARNTGKRRTRAQGRSSSPSEGLDPDIRSALHLGAYQLGWTRIPARAAVGATVEEVRGPGRSMVNAVLRRVADDLAGDLAGDRAGDFADHRAGDFADHRAARLTDGPGRWPDVGTELSYPDWVVDVLESDLGAVDARAALEAMNRPASVSVRPDGYIQDPASQMVVQYVASLAGDGPVLDMCAAPGGKATALAGTSAPERNPSLAGSETHPVDLRFVVAADVSEARSRVVARNAADVGCSSLATVVADGADPPWRSGSFETILLDAPCSGLGVLRRRPDARWRRRRSDMGRLATLQRRLATSAIQLLRPGGSLVYSVCTVSAAETIEFDRWLQSVAPALIALAPPGAPWRALGRGALLLPQDADSDGMYVLGLRLSGESARLNPCP